MVGNWLAARMMPEKSAKVLGVPEIFGLKQLKSILTCLAGPEILALPALPSLASLARCARLMMPKALCRGIAKICAADRRSTAKLCGGGARGIMREDRQWVCYQWAAE